MARGNQCLELLQINSKVDLRQWEGKLLSTLHSLKEGLVQTRSETTYGRTEQTAVKVGSSDNATFAESTFGFVSKGKVPFRRRSSDRRSIWKFTSCHIF